MSKTTGQLILQDGTKIEAESFGFDAPTSGEIVFSTGMTSYPESLTDPSYEGQILVMTYPIIGNYGVPRPELWESDHIHVKALIVSNYNETPSHFQSKRTLSQWLKDEKIPGLIIKDTRFLTQKIREHGVMLAKIAFGKDEPKEFYNPDLENLVEQVSPKEIERYGKGPKKIVMLDCGAKENIVREFVQRGVEVVRAPWDFDPFASPPAGGFDALFISNGPGDPKRADKTIETIKKALEKDIPILGICLGNQLLALAAGGDTSKLKYGHRSQNQPAIQNGTKRCFITTQNHGFAVTKIPKDFKAWFTNANDGSNEGIIHKTKPVMSVQFHPEARPGPLDCEWIFEYFLEKI